MNPKICPTTQGNSNQNNTSGDNTQNNLHQQHGETQLSIAGKENITNVDTKGLDYMYDLLSAANQQIKSQNSQLRLMEREIDKRDLVFVGVTIIYFLTMF